MKCFVIKSGDQFIANSTRGISTYWDGVKVITVEYEDEAKHYKTKSPPTSWIKNTIKRQEKALKDHKSNLNKHMHQWEKNRFSRLIDATNTALQWLNDAEVVEVDVEVPSYERSYSINWNRWRKRQGTQGDSKMILEQHNHSKYFCKACGIILKNIPFYRVPEGNNSRICIPCLKLRVDSINTAYEGMNEEHRTDITNELILGSM